MAGRFHVPWEGKGRVALPLSRRGLRAMTTREKQALDSVRDGSMTQRSFYMTYAWESKARQILKRDRYECQECRRRGRYSRAQCVHHKQELKARPELAFEDGNLESLCKRCHNLAHGKHLSKAKGEQRFTTPERW